MSRPDLHTDDATPTLPPPPSLTPDTRPPEPGDLYSALTPGQQPPVEAAGAQTVPGYEVLEKLGQGGMGVVYRARHLALGRVVALKMIRSAEHASSEEMARFLAEARAVAALSHPNIVPVYEIGQDGGLPWFTMEYVEGGSLGQLVKDGPLPAREAARLVEQIARGVACAHAAGIVHRDLKPENVLLAGSGVASAPRASTPGADATGLTPKITDFGLARRLESDHALTRTGAVLGTPAYMAPEQASGKGKGAGPAADVWAVGAVLYRVLTGRPPFLAATDFDTLIQVIDSEPVAPRQLNPVVPRDLETICLKCLQKGPAKRYASAEDLADDLRRFLAGEPIRARPVGAVERTAKWVRRNRVVTALAAAVLLVTLVGVAGVVWKYLDAERQKGIALENEEAAQKEAARANKAREFLVSIFKKAETDVKGGNVTVRELLAEAETDIPGKFADQPELRGELVKAIGEVKRGIARRTPQAMILEVRGKVTLHSHKGDEKRAVPQALVNLDDRLTLSPDAEVQLVFLADLHKERLRPGAEVTVDFKGCKPADAVRQRDNSVLMTFVRLPKGTFYMGWNGKPSLAKKTPIKEDFEIAVHTVTQGQWEAVMGRGNNPSSHSRKGNYRRDVIDISDEELKLFPVENVSWDDAQAFIKKLNEKERVHGYLYRLPTEAEWEYACRYGATSEEECSYHFYFDRPTNDLSSKQANFNGNYPFGKGEKGPYLQRPARVGAYPPNKLGLCDMHGNVWQWTSSSEGSFRVFRGGCWYGNGLNCQAAYRDGNAPAIRSSQFGFRLARVPVR
jgi:formylglycine-generating enzyme required for sulfatase activity/tRNA A-37 threonylcarbamoyl transferase component Bud32